MAIYFQEYGDKSGPLMLFLHGGGVSGWMWDKQVKYFTDFHCVVPDLLKQDKKMGFEEFSIGNSAEQLLMLIEKKAKGKKVIIIGFSLGAQVAIQMVSKKPHLIDYAIINSALVRPIPFSSYFISSSVKLTFPLIKNKLFSKVQAKTLYIGKDYFEKYYEESSNMRRDTLISVLKENMAFELPGNFSQAKGKILVTVGDKERAIMKKSAADIVKKNPNCKGVILPGIGHGVSLAEPQFFNQMVEKWIIDGKIPEGKIIN